MKINLLLALVLSVTILGCHKDKNENVTTYYQIDQRLYPFLFNKGSFWVYIKADSNTQDSIIVDSIQKYTLYLYELNAEYFEINYHGFPNDSIYSDYLIGYVICRCLGPSGYLLLSSEKIGDSSENAEIVDVLDSMSIENHLYKKVVKMNIHSDDCLKDNYYLYYVDSIGMIKKEKYNGTTILETWNLKSFKVNLLKMINTLPNKPASPKRGMSAKGIDKLLMNEQPIK